MGQRSRRRSSAAAPTSPRATSSSIRCCSWKTTSSRYCPRCGAARSLRRHGRMHVSRRCDQADPPGPLQHGRRSRAAPSALLKRLRGERDGTAPAASEADEDAAPAAEDPALHPRHRAGRARLLPHAAVLARRFRRERRAAGALPRRPLRRRAAARAARRAAIRRRRSSIRRSASIIRGCRGAHRRQRSRSCRPSGGRAARSACW